MSITITEVSRSFGSQQALDRVSFTVETGEIAGFIGPNGAGKTTLMKIMMGTLLADSGQVQVLGKEVTGDARQIRQDIGYLPENNPLYPEMYVREYLRMVARMYGLGTKSRDRVEVVIGLTGLERESRKKIGALSKGYRQRVGLAQALVHDPPVLILDEPTSGLDPNQIVEIRTLISRMASSKTVILSTHIMQEVEAICDHIIIINQGRIVADRRAGEIGQDADNPVQTILLELGETIEASQIRVIPGLVRAVPLKEKTWLLSGPEGEGFRKNIFRFAVDSGLTVLSMQTREKSLEEVFRELTGEA